MFFGIARAGGFGGGKDMFPARTRSASTLGNSWGFNTFIAGLACNGGGPPLSPLADGRDGFLYATRPGAVYRINPGSPGFAAYVSFLPSDGPYTPHTPLTEVGGTLTELPEEPLPTARSTDSTDPTPHCIRRVR